MTLWTNYWILLVTCMIIMSNIGNISNTEWLKKTPEDLTVNLKYKRYDLEININNVISNLNVLTPSRIGLAFRSIMVKLRSLSLVIIVTNLRSKTNCSWKWVPVLHYWASTLIEQMNLNFDNGLKDIPKIANNWMFNFLPICRKITVAKTFILSKISQNAVVLPTPSQHRWSLFDEVIFKFDRDQNFEGSDKPSIVSKDVYMLPKKTLVLVYTTKVTSDLPSRYLDWVDYRSNLHGEWYTLKNSKINPSSSTHLPSLRQANNSRTPLGRKSIQASVLKEPRSALFCPIISESQMKKKDTAYTFHWAKGLRFFDVFNSNLEF